MTTETDLIIARTQWATTYGVLLELRDSLPSRDVTTRKHLDVAIELVRYKLDDAAKAVLEAATHSTDFGDAS